MNIYLFHRILQRALITLIFLPGFLAIISMNSFAQNNNQPFSTVSIGVGYNPPMLKYDLNEFWDTGPGGQFFVETPFYWGVTGLAVQGTPFKGKDEVLPDYLMVEVLLNWGPEIRLHRRFFVRPALQNGVSYWRFEENQTYAGLGNVWESEFQAGALLVVSVVPLTDWQIDVRLHRTVIFTRKHLWLTGLQVSLVRRFSTPSWLKKILE